MSEQEERIKKLRLDVDLLTARMLTHRREDAFRLRLALLNTHAALVEVSAALRKLEQDANK